MNSGDFQNAIQALSGGESARVWSLIVTVFGDLAQNAGDEIAGPALADILSPVGVRPEAMRVALHRLRNEGWIETRKQGRTALHGLSAHGLSQSAQASARIYGAALPAQPDWHVLFFPPNSAAQDQTRAKGLDAEGYTCIAANVYLKNSAFEGTQNHALVLQGDLKNVPDWLGQALAPEPLRSGFTQLGGALHAMNIDADFACTLSEIETATLRTLIVHRWRKLVLKLPVVPEVLFGPRFEGTACRAQVLQALDALKRPALSELD